MMLVLPGGHQCGSASVVHLQPADGHGGCAPAAGSAGPLSPGRQAQPEGCSLGTDWQVGGVSVYCYSSLCPLISKMYLKH